MRIYKKMYLLMFFIAISIFLYFSEVLEKSDKYANRSMKIISSAFAEGEIIPSKYICDGENISPPLEWSDFPDNTKTFVILCEDPDAFPKARVYWLMYNIPRNAHKLKENVLDLEKLPQGIIQGINDFRKIGYGGSCPPSGIHHYIFRIYALDIHLNVEPGLNKIQILNIIDKHVLAQGQLMGRYRR